ncbi:hypothetical protein [Dichotomicrobium thermohalophilum]|uniref:Uncharacterized protein n=1 Tax=Dichotomicrobium thermohalophilum TaxID=933063 RepID=A0A397PK08_9HYPH|nr:hypothetical protein [Dichotomicrobium thermohalophilum]RIA47487.1 hypothetical protein BXY53_2040 [Dichotomicrobium thermohalophilum]
MASNKLPSTYRAQHEAILRDVFQLLGIVQMSVATGKAGITHSALIDWLKLTLERAGVEPNFDLDDLMARAKQNEAAKQKPQQPTEKPELRAVK